MNQDEQLAKEFAEFQKVAKDNKNVDVAALMVGALNMADKNQNTLPAKSKRWAYVVSLGAPPLGLLFAVKYFFSEEEDARQAAWICIILTAISGILAWAMLGPVISGSGASLKQINPGIIQSTLQ